MTPQTRFHKHWTIPITAGSLLHRVLRKPLFHSTNTEYVHKSRLVFGPCLKHNTAKGPCHYLSLLGLLHGLTGLVMDVLPNVYLCKICDAYFPYDAEGLTHLHDHS